MKCNVIFHPGTTTLSKCCIWPFEKRWWQDITCSADGACGPVKLPNSSWMTLGKSVIGIINRTFCWPWNGHPPLPRVWPHNHRTAELKTQETTLSGVVHWDMFLLLQVWRQSSSRTQSMFYGEGFWLMMGGKLQKGCSVVWFTGFSLHCNEE